MPSLAPLSSNTRKTPPTSNYSALSHLPSSLPSTPILYYVDQLGLPSRDRENKQGTYRVPHHRILFVRMGILHSDLCPSQLFLLFKVVKEQKGSTYEYSRTSAKPHPLIKLPFSSFFPSLPSKDSLALPGRIFYFGNREWSWRISREESHQRVVGRGNNLTKEIKSVYFIENI